MENQSVYRRYLPIVLWAAGILVVYFLLQALIAPFTEGITLNLSIVLSRLKEIGTFLISILAGLALIEIYVYQMFFRQPKSRTKTIITRILQGLIALAILLGIISFLETTDLIRLGTGFVASIIHFPGTIITAFRDFIYQNGIAYEEDTGLIAGILIAVLLVGLLVIIQFLSTPKISRQGLPYLLVLPALLGVLFLIVYPFLFEIRLAFSNASLGTQATKNASYGLIYGWENLKTLFTGNVAKDAKFFEVFVRTILWTVINVVFHISGGMGLALLLNRPMKLRGFYRTLLVFPWAIPTTIAAMALRNEFDNRYGMFNILLTDLQSWLTSISQHTASLVGIGNAFAFLSQHIGPVSWKQDPFWAFVSILISNIWLGIPFMAVIILGGLQSISQEYYEAAEIDGASKFAQWRFITLPLIRPVLTPAIVLGVVWTFNKFDVIYLITQGGPQEKTDILVSSMYKAAFQFYRYGFTAMFALVIFIFLLLFTVFFVRMSGGLKSATD
jgi:arabinogalactan oligomer / maltooligosaccharide transport system permease protein